MKRVRDHTRVLKCVVEQNTFNIISAYALQVGIAQLFKVKFWEDLEC